MCLTWKKVFVSGAEPHAVEGLAARRMGNVGDEPQGAVLPADERGPKRLAAEATEFDKLITAIQLVMKTA